MTFAPAISFVIAALWVAWIVFWMAAALDTKPTRWREPIGSQALHILPLLFCAALLAQPHWSPPVLTARVVPAGPLPAIFGGLCVLGGLALAVWARVCLGRNWSGTVTVKQNHALVRTGPYSLIRHPIYTGLLLALIGTAIAIGEWRGVLGVVFALAGFLWKIRVEERRMRQTFPEYEHYRKQTAALLPLIY
jgi:protein-S-isoprenylcysteine O-methyltransferase Ste14